MNNIEGDYTDNSQHNTNNGNGNATFSSQFKPCEGSSNENAGSAVCCASKAGGACCASAAEAGQDASTSSDCPESMPFAKKFSLRRDMAAGQLSRSIAAPMAIGGLALVSILLRVLHRLTKQGSPDGVSIASAEIEPLCQTTEDEHLRPHTITTLEDSVAKKRHCSRWAAGSLACVALVSTAAVVSIIVYPQQSITSAQISEIVGLDNIQTQHVESQYNADSITFTGGAHKPPLKFGDQTLEYQQGYRFFWTMDDLPNEDPYYETLKVVRQSLDSDGLELFHLSDTSELKGEGLLLNLRDPPPVDSWGLPSGVVCPPLASRPALQPDAMMVKRTGGDAVEWSFNFNEGSGCLQMTSRNSNGECLTAKGSDWMGYLYLSECDADDSNQCWQPYEESTKIQSKIGGKCIAFTTRDTQKMKGTLASTCDVGNAANAVGNFAVVLAYPLAAASTADALASSIVWIGAVLKDCDSDWVIQWDIKEV